MEQREELVPRRSLADEVTLVRLYLAFPLEAASGCVRRLPRRSALVSGVAVALQCASKARFILSSATAQTRVSVATQLSRAH